MCGIFGQIKKVVHRNQCINRYAMLQRANLCHHRGPDNTIDIFLTYKDYELYFVFHRLAINGLDTRSNQPMKIGDTIIHYVILSKQLLIIPKRCNKKKKCE